MKFVGIAVGLCVGLALIGLASAETYYGNNSWTRHRLAWQHGNSFGLTQGYNQGNHNNSVNRYSLDFSMSTGTPLLAITEGSTCQVQEPNQSGGLGWYVVQTAPGSWAGRGGTDYYFYGHISNTWVALCSSTTYVYQGQITAWSGCSGTCSGPSVHTSVLNPGNTCYCGSATGVKFSLLSGIQFDGVLGADPPTKFYVSDSVMPGDDNTKPQPYFYPSIFNRWSSDGGLNYVGSTRNNGGGPGVHGWGNGVVQDFAGPGHGHGNGYGAVMLRDGTRTAYWVHGVIWDRYLYEGGAWGWLGYPISDEFFWFYYYGVALYRQNFQYGCIWFNMNDLGTNAADYSPGSPCNS